jgi:hypothetical protein
MPNISLSSAYWHWCKIMRVGSVKFEGNGPVYLRTIKHAKASVLADTIQLTLFALVEGQGQDLVQIETQMTPGAALELAHTLLCATNESFQLTSALPVQFIDIS